MMRRPCVDYLVTVKDVGQGSCTIIKNLRNNKFIIIDAGSSSKNEIKKKAVASINALLGMSEESHGLRIIKFT
jgi:hypothetical protein